MLQLSARLDKNYYDFILLVDAQNRVIDTGVINENFQGSTDKPTPPRIKQHTALYTTIYNIKHN